MIHSTHELMLMFFFYLQCHPRTMVSVKKKFILGLPLIMCSPRGAEGGGGVKKRGGGWGSDSM